MKRFVIIAALSQAILFAASYRPSDVLEDPTDAKDIIHFLPIAYERGIIDSGIQKLEHTIRIYMHFSAFNEGKMSIVDLIRKVGKEIDRDSLKGILKARSTDERINKIRIIYDRFVEEININIDLIRLCSPEMRPKILENVEDNSAPNSEAED